MNKKINKRVIAHTAIPVLAIILLFALINAGYNYFVPREIHSGNSLIHQSDAKESLIRGEFSNNFRKFCRALGAYFISAPFWFGLLVIGVLYCWIIFRLFHRYFNLFKPVKYLDVLLHPGALESIPHCLMVLVVYFLFFSSNHLNAFMIGVYCLISMPFVYKLMEDVFITAEKEGTVEIYLNKRKSNLALMVEFIRKRVVRLVVIPVIFLLMLMVYWDFLYASIAISGDEAAAPAVFFSNFNNAFFVNYPTLHNGLILFHIGLFTVMMFAILYFVSIAGGSRHE